MYQGRKEAPNEQTWEWRFDSFVTKLPLLKGKSISVNDSATQTKRLRKKIMRKTNKTRTKTKNETNFKIINSPMALEFLSDEQLYDGKVKYCFSFVVTKHSSSILTKLFGIKLKNKTILGRFACSHEINSGEDIIFDKLLAWLSELNSQHKVNEYSFCLDL